MHLAIRSLSDPGESRRIILRTTVGTRLEPDKLRLERRHLDPAPMVLVAVTTRKFESLIVQQFVA